MPVLLPNLYTFKRELYHQIKIEEGDTFTKISKVMKMTLEDLEGSFYMPVNAQAPNGVKEGGNTIHQIRAGKIFYISALKCLNKRVNIHKVFHNTTSIRCMYDTDEPMKNRYILFWEANNELNGFKENRTGNIFSRLGTKPIGLGVTDGDGILNGESLRWIEEIDGNKIKFKNTGRFPEHAKENAINFTCTLETFSKDGNSSKRETFYKKIGSRYKHNLLGNIDLHDIGYGNFIWAKKVSRFVDFRKYVFMPLSVDIINDRTFNTKDLFQIDPSLLTTVIPDNIEKSKKNRQLLVFNKENFQRVSNDLKNYNRNRLNSSLDKFFNIPSDTIYSVNSARQILYPDPKYYNEPDPEFQYIQNQDVDFGLCQKKITEETPLIKEIKLNLNLPEWVARLRTLRKECEYLYGKLKEIKKPYMEHVQQLMHLKILSKIRATYPYSEKPIDSDKIIIANQIPNEFLKLKDHINKYLICDNPDGSESKEIYELLKKKTSLLRKHINSKELYNSTKDYIGTKNTTQWSLLQLEYQKNKKALIEKHLIKIANALSLEIEKSYLLFKDMDIFDINSTFETRKTFFERVYEEDLYVVIKKVLKSEKENINYENAIFFLLNDFELYPYISRSKGPSSLLIALIDISKHINTKLKEGRFSHLSFSLKEIEEMCILIYKKISKSPVPGIKFIKAFCESRESLRSSINSIRQFAISVRPNGFRLGAVGLRGFDTVVLLLQLCAFKNNLNEGNVNNLYTLAKEFLSIAYQVSGIGLSLFTIAEHFTEPVLFAKPVSILLWLQVGLLAIKFVAACISYSGNKVELKVLATDLVAALASLLVYIYLGGFVSAILYVLIIGVNLIFTRIFKGGPFSVYMRESLDKITESNEYVEYSQIGVVDTQIRVLYEKIDSLKNTEFDHISWRGVVPLLNCGFVKYDKKGFIEEKETVDILEGFVDIKCRYKKIRYNRNKLIANGVPVDLVVKYYKFALENPHDSWAPKRINRAELWEKNEMFENLNPTKRVSNGFIIYDNINNNWFSPDKEELMFI